MSGYVLHRNRGYIYIKGPDAKIFLQGLVTNDIELVDRERTIYTALLTPQGRFLFDFFVMKSEEGLLLDVDYNRAQELFELLRKYKLRSQVEITPSESPQTVACVFGESAIDDMGLQQAPGNTSWRGEKYSYVDPRLTSLGIRTNWTEEELKAKGFQCLSQEQYELQRIQQGVPLSGHDLLPEKSIPLECGLDELNAVAWEKGCYLGQELTARTKYRGLVRKRLLPVTIQGEGVEPMMPLLFNGEKMGSMRSIQGEKGLALIRLEVLEMLGEGWLEASGAKVKPHVLPWMKFDL